MNKNKIIIIVTNIILGIIKFYILSLYALGAFLDDYVEPISETKRYIKFSEGVIIAIILDIIVNIINTKIIKKNNSIKTNQPIIFSIIITIIEIFIILILG